MGDIAKVEGSEIVIRIPISALTVAPDYRGFTVHQPKKFAPHVARELSGENCGERLWIEDYFEAAVIRAAEGDAPGFYWDDDGWPNSTDHTMEQS